MWRKDYIKFYLIGCQFITYGTLLLFPISLQISGNVRSDAESNGNLAREGRGERRKDRRGWTNYSSFPFQVTTPILRFLGELCQNRQQRLKFEMTSCSAVLLFREVSKIIVAYGEKNHIDMDWDYCIHLSGNRLLALSEVPKDDVYRLRFKNMGICFFILKVCYLIH